jgi:hypothetical protein
MSRRERLRIKLQDLFLCFRSSMDPHFNPALLSEMGVDITRFDLADETLQGGPFFRPMSLGCLSSLNKRPDMYQIPFWNDDGHPNNPDAYMIQDAINNQLFSSRDEDQWRAYHSTQWEPIG